MGRVLEQSLLLDDALAMALTQRDQKIIDFEGSWWMGSEPKDAQIRQLFDLSTTRYYQLLTELLDDDAALEYDPLVVRRLRRRRDRRRNRPELQAIEDDGTR
tara:strand:- start:57 stop:362 length:306 start_codon:yes stop_codon:yes gene_type:complete